MARAYRVLLSCRRLQASFAVLERDFSTAGRLFTGARSGLDAGYAEMVLFLNGTLEYTPQKVPALTNDQVLEAVHTRLSDPRAEMKAISSTKMEQDNDVDEYAFEMMD